MSINNLDMNIMGDLGKFEDDFKIGGVDSEEDDIEQLVK